MALKQVVLLKLVQQLSQVYQTMRISDFAKLADFLSLHDCEKLIVQAVSNNQVCVCLSVSVLSEVGCACFDVSGVSVSVPVPYDSNKLAHLRN